MRRLVLLSFATLAGCASGGATPAEGTTAQTIRMSDASSQGMAGGLVMTSSTTARVERLSFPFEKVWNMLPVAYDTLGIPVADFDQKNHLIGNMNLKIRRRLGKTPLTRYLECGTTQVGPNAESYEITLSVISKVSTADAGATTVATTVEATGKPTFSGSAVRCTSKGTLEDGLMNVLKFQLEK